MWKIYLFKSCGKLRGKLIRYQNFDASDVNPPQNPYEAQWAGVRVKQRLRQYDYLVKSNREN